MSETAPDEDAERGDLALFIGRNAQRLLQPGARFCWPGFLVPQAWFLYRKMYLWSALVCAGPLLLAFLPGGLVLSWATSILGAFGLRFYLAAAKSTVARIRAEAGDEEEARALIARAGGVSRIGAAFGLAFAFSTFILSLKGVRVSSSG